ncbi:dihydrofolate reductase family protein [Streptomyces sp. cmx-18-6]|uniref:dihydrofolate reductase family protein n=1 Tax=Streptomyces sp. cmx-18-6 TaxID=2790930 RepID=UPI0039809785
MNAMPKYVASRTLRDPGWANTTVLNADLTAEIRRIKAASEEETVVLGSGGLLGTLMEAGLVDEYRLLVFPLILGRGKRLFTDGMGPRDLTLTATEPTPSGVLINTYRCRAEG